nr:MAG TPA: hypothetical protein [Caudoviricetes sp.]
MLRLDAYHGKYDVPYANPGRYYIGILILLL